MLSAVFPLLCQVWLVMRHVVALRLSWFLTFVAFVWWLALISCSNLWSTFVQLVFLQPLVFFFRGLAILFLLNQPDWCCRMVGIFGVLYPAHFLQLIFHLVFLESKNFHPRVFLHGSKPSESCFPPVPVHFWLSVIFVYPSLGFLAFLASPLVRLWPVSALSTATLPYFSECSFLG